jgi:hypothetical protein
MTQTAIFSPFFATILLTMTVWIYLYIRRLPFILSLKIDVWFMLIRAALTHLTA